MANTIILPFSELQAELNDEAMIDPNAVIDITENGLYNVAKYGYADVDVPQPSGKITITENGTDIDVSEYASADVNVPQPSGKITITENGTDIDVSEYATADVNVAGGSSDLSTAEVTFINSAEGKSYKLLANAFISVANNDTIGGNTEIDISEQETFEIVIYKGSQFIPLTKFLHFDAQTMPIVTGDIEFVTSPAYGFIVTGDGTITAKGTESMS